MKGPASRYRDRKSECMTIGMDSLFVHSQFYALSSNLALNNLTTPSHFCENSILFSFHSNSKRILPLHSFMEILKKRHMLMKMFCSIRQGLQCKQTKSWSPVTQRVKNYFLIVIPIKKIFKFPFSFMSIKPLRYISKLIRRVSVTTAQMTMK